VCPMSKRGLRPKDLTVQTLAHAEIKLIIPIKIVPARGVKPESSSVMLDKITLEKISTTFMPVNSWKMMLVMFIQLHFTYF